MSPSEPSRDMTIDVVPPPLLPPLQPKRKGMLITLPSSRTFTSSVAFPSSSTPIPRRPSLTIQQAIAHAFPSVSAPPPAHNSKQGLQLQSKPESPTESYFPSTYSTPTNEEPAELKDNTSAKTPSFRSFFPPPTIPHPGTPASITELSPFGTIGAYDDVFGVYQRPIYAGDLSPYATDVERRAERARRKALKKEVEKAKKGKEKKRKGQRDNAVDADALAEKLEKATIGTGSQPTVVVKPKR